ncbi:hypothetical protein TELCIR_17338 [Teladorsagia circumcincta]|uniref:Uncharacterized protein n=1 Tax=Teladorsagia circumcincta TaxID=45464 RepID=A0A2G9TT87_TELCI|nr:hypothetical protein TELCIR_17338 [Teladorsagia circumcincta]
MPQQSVDDAFGEVAMPRQAFGQWRNSDEENNEFGNRVDLPWQFERESNRPMPWVRPFERMNRWDGPQWGQENRWPQENHIFEPFQDAPEEEPQMRITHHYDKDSQTPQRVVTELFGNTAPEVIGHMLGQKNAQAQLQMQQQQQQPWPQPWAQPAAQPWPQPWALQPQMWDQPHWDQPLMPQQAPPMVYFFNPMPQPQQQFQQQVRPVNVAVFNIHRFKAGQSIKKITLSHFRTFCIRKKEKTQEKIVITCVHVLTNIRTYAKSQPVFHQSS